MYRLDELGWVQFQRLCDIVLERELGTTPGEWDGDADQVRRGPATVITWKGLMDAEPAAVEAELRLVTLSRRGRRDARVPSPPA